MREMQYGSHMFLTFPVFYFCRQRHVCPSHSHPLPGRSLSAFIDQSHGPSHLYSKAVSYIPLQFKPLMVLAVRRKALWLQPA